MITQIDISNFRSIKHQSIPLKKLNILYGANGSGKSSVAYAPYVMRNFFVNPNQRLNSLFNLGFINLGSLDQVSSQSKTYKEISVAITTSLFDSNSFATCTLSLEDIFGSSISYNLYEEETKLSIEFPFTASEKIEAKFQNDLFLWNGLTFEKFGKDNTKSIFAYQLNSLYHNVKSIEIISVKRGFFNPVFSTEMENIEESKFALQIREEGLDFDLKIDKYFSQIFNKNFRFVAIPGSNSFYLRTHNATGLTTDLVNEGFGVNQAIYMLIKLLKTNTSLAFIEEPEIHLHPSAQSKLVDVFTEIVHKENKQIFLSTHSENIVSSVLAKIAKGELDKNDVQFYLAKYENDETVIIPQDVNDKGQIEGGLMNFMETELSNLKAMLGV